MIELFYKLNIRIGCNKVCSAWNKLIRVLFNMLYPVYCRKHPVQDGLNHDKRQEKVIISLTSFPARFNTLHLCIHALLSQTVKPDKVILWLTDEECKGLELPETLTKMCESGLEIRYAPENLRPHNKLYYTLKENPNAVVISVDDDIVYSTHLVEKLLDAHREHPDCVCCNMAHEITLVNGKPDLYDNWNGGAIGKAGISHYFVALGVGGVLYPAGCFDEEYFDATLIKNLALSADDLWLKMTELRLGIPVLKVAPDTKIPLVVSGSQKIALGKENNGEHKNDIIMNKLCDHYHMEWEHL